MEIGRLCVKLAGRDAGKLAVVVDQIDSKFVLIDGNVRRRKCNIMHLEPFDEVLKIKKGASHSDVVSEFKKLKLDVWNTKPKKKMEKQASRRKLAEKSEKQEAKEEKKSEIKKEKPKTVKKEQKK